MKILREKGETFSSKVKTAIVDHLAKEIKSSSNNVCSAKKLTKGSTVLLLRMVRFSAEQTLVVSSELLSTVCT